MRKSPAILALAAATALIGCGTEPDKKGDSLEITASPLPSPFRVGDTSGFWLGSKTVILTNGSARTTDDYPSFHLVASDTTVVGVVDDRRLIGRKEGTTEVRAVDNKSSLKSDPVTVNVVGVSMP
jgi:hypothetical protein